MPWSLSQRNGKWCVIKDSDGSVSGCHDSRADAIKQQRALYANESRVAAMYAELDALAFDMPLGLSMETNLQGQYEGDPPQGGPAQMQPLRRRRRFEEDEVIAVLLSELYD